MVVSAHRRERPRRLAAQHGMDHQAQALGGLHRFIGDGGGHHCQRKSHGIFGIARGGRGNHLRKGAFIATKASAGQIVPHEGPAAMVRQQREQVRQRIDRPRAAFIAQTARKILGNRDAAIFAATPLAQQQHRALFKARQIGKHPHRRSTALRQGVE